MERARASPQLILRPEYHQWEFLRSEPASFDAVLIPARYCSQFPEGHPRHFAEHNQLVQAAADAERPRYDDPGTPGLCAKGVLKYSSAVRLRQIAAAQAVELPLRPEALRDRTLRNEFVDAAAQDQVGSATLAGPYLDALSTRDERHGLNVLMTQRIVQSVSEQISSAFLQGTRHAMVSGALAEMAPDYAATGVQRVFVRVRGLK